MALRARTRHASFGAAFGFFVLLPGSVAPMLSAVPEEAFIHFTLGSASAVLVSGVLPTWSWRWPVGVALVGLAITALVLAILPPAASSGQIIAAAFLWGTLAIGGILNASLKYAGARREFAARLELERERRRADDAKSKVEEMLVKLQELDRQKTAFFQNISHELRTPLTVLLLPLSTLAKEADASQRPEFAMIERNAQRLLRLVNQLLDLSRLEAGRKTSTPELHALPALVEPIVEGFEDYARRKGLTLEVHGAGADLPAALVDPDDFDKVLCNLLSNACKFTEAGGTVVVRLDVDGEWVRVDVEDTGIGITEADRFKIFERFHQVDGGASRRYEGSGIGLALAKELADAGGGRLTVESELGVGSTFSIWLPRGSTDTATRPIQAPPAGQRDERARTEAMALQAEVGGACPDALPAHAPSDEDRDNLALLLIVDDNPDMRAVIADVCCSQFRILEAPDGDQGLSLIREHHPDIVVSDVMMPGLDGHALVREVRAIPERAGTPIVLLTAKAGAERRLDSLENGADDYLTKPFEPRELLARLRSLTRLKELATERSRRYVR